jgi:PTH1 family peptidyl-tRNA hydrolase
MSLFQRMPDTSDPIRMMYTVGLNKTVLIVGLGNIGKEYDGTRHNIGFEAVEAFVSANPELGQWSEKKSQKCLMASGQLGQTRVIVIKPTTFMNLSGEAVQAVTAFYKIPAAQVIIVHDELDVNFGNIRTRTGGSSAGHNGIKSITELVGEDTGRVRIGIGPKKPAQIDSADFVLGKFSATEVKQLPNLIRETNAILSEYAYGTQLPTETRSFIV